ncbi:MAG: permease [Candidatus Omnitrophica bacterium]|nr:permease [Candidatus Omnitrophota bacterium]
MLLNFSDWFVYQVLDLPRSSTLAAALDFFIYDSIKILFLLYVMILVIGVLRTFIPQRSVKKWMANNGLMGNVYAALFGAITPFCSCSSIPMFLSFLKAGISLSAALTFLVASPLINEYLVIIMIGLFGWKITVLYVLSGLLLAIVSGLVIGRMKLERHLVVDMVASGNEELSSNEPQISSFKDRIVFGLNEASSIVQKIWLWILVGVALGSFIHNYLPQEQIHALISGTGIFSVPIATLLGVPMYGSCAAIVPVALVLFQKGIPLGTALAFMMAVTGLSLPEAIMLRRAMNLHLILIYFGVVTAGIIAIGYAFNFLQIVLTS